MFQTTSFMFQTTSFMFQTASFMFQTASFMFQTASKNLFATRKRVKGKMEIAITILIKKETVYCFVINPQKHNLRSHL
jgi:hypothetical protein